MSNHGVKSVALHAAITVVIVMLIGLVLGQVLPAADQASEYQQKAEAYCYQYHGGSDLVNVRAIGNHGGLHCEANDEGVHLHDITEEALTVAYVANQSNASVDLSAIDRTQPWHQRGYWPDLVGAMGVLSIMLVVVVVVWGARGGLPRP